MTPHTFVPLTSAPSPAPEATAGQRAACTVALVNMPFVSIYQPSLQLGLLKSLATDAGFRAEDFYFNLEFSQLMGSRAYEQMAHHRGRLFGDWLFSVAAFGDEAPDPRGLMLDHFAEETDALLADLKLTRDQLIGIRNDGVPHFIDSLLEKTDWSRFRIVGFTSTFQQNAASFALARRIKKRFPATLIIFGGANFEGDMGKELMSHLDFMDYAFDGESDESFPEFLEVVAAGGDPTAVPGVLARERIASNQPEPADSRPPFNHLDRLPVPDFAEYFDRALDLGVISEESRRLVSLPFESSRGCWWGQKHHCTFCGLNGSTMGFRSKSSSRVRQELAELAKAYGSLRFEAVDNILDMKYFSDLLPELQEEGFNYQFFYEVKSNLTRERIKALSESGIVHVQPGIESLDSRVLKLMRKGITGLQNVNMLRWGMHYGIDIAWNIIWGFPGEETAFYDDQLETIRRLRHLQPPTSTSRIWMERYSPLFSDRDSFAAEYINPEASYAYVYPARMDLARIAYFFDYEMTDALPDAAYQPIRDEVREWQKSWRTSAKPTLLFWASPGQIYIDDFRDPADRKSYRFQDDSAALYRACSDRPTNARQLKKTLALEQSVEQIEEILFAFERQDLMLHEDGSFLSLALPAKPRPPTLVTPKQWPALGLDA
ncbi:RiPP maturation radical SAM C-methyltransferase [Streptomyces sp. SID13726]|uniref:RiPP maturation radical SAM C-methyltransferase n=1 Tax=Streptomyces sp. SID13726 TaxID=2706058 RepID=UPI0013BB6A12|nr:RiPP maturation radical SAM C-methyltransferase [Streptomyces sp. SID13726]NEA98542.1 RiPP maturation radical SAM protein 1 [Streptomyces sp. SID13726]